MVKEREGGKKKKIKKKAVVQLSTLSVREIPFLFKIRQRTQCRTGQQAVSFRATSSCCPISINRPCRFISIHSSWLSPCLICKRWPSHTTKGMMNQKDRLLAKVSAGSCTPFFFFLLIMHFSASLASLPSPLNLSGVSLSSDLCVLNSKELHFWNSACDVLWVTNRVREFHSISQFK